MDNQIPKIKLCDHKKFCGTYNDVIGKSKKYKKDVDLSIIPDLNTELSMDEIKYYWNILKRYAKELNESRQGINKSA